MYNMKAFLNDINYMIIHSSVKNISLTPLNTVLRQQSSQVYSRIYRLCKNFSIPPLHKLRSCIRSHSRINMPTSSLLWNRRNPKHCFSVRRKVWFLSTRMNRRTTRFNCCTRNFSVILEYKVTGYCEGRSTFFCSNKVKTAFRWWVGKEEPDCITTEFFS